MNAATSDPNANQGDLGICFVDCKHERKEKKEDDIIPCLQCSHCGHWYHFDCINLAKDDYNGIWPSYSCRKVPRFVVEMKQSIDTIISTLQKAVESSSEAIKLITKKCESLENENKDLRSQINVLGKQLQQKFTPCCSEQSNKPSLLVGDSLLRDVESSRLHKTDVTSLPSAKVKDVLQYLKNDKGTYQHIYICAGTNDCSSPDFDGENVTKTYQDLVATAKERVVNVENITISSIPPRTDDDEAQKRIEIINANLSTIATDAGTQFVNQDNTFKLHNGTPNDGYLVSDGKHLSFKGTNKLCLNMKIPLNSNANGDVCKRKNQRTLNKASSNETSERKENSDQSWQVVRNRKRWSPRKTQSNSQRQSSTRESTARCWNCSETNHMASQCKFGGPIRCHTCGASGHKSKFCTWC